MKRYHRARFAAGLTIFCFLLLFAAQSYSVPPTQLRLDAASSGEMLKCPVLSSGAICGISSINFILNATLGQAVVCDVSSTSYTLSQGFWYTTGPTNCCVGIRGNVNGVGGVTVADLTFLVQYLFNSGPAPACLNEANVNGIGGITVSDLTYLVQYLFNGGPTPPSCP